MRYVLAFIVAAAVLFAAWSFRLFPHGLEKVFLYDACGSPRTYHLGTVDPRFDKTNSQLMSYIQQATDVWNAAAGKTLFVPAGDGTITVNFVYDDRQALSEKISTMEDHLSDEKGDLESRKTRFESESRAFETRLSEFNRTVQYWNLRGGAPSDQYDALLKEQSSLKAEAERLNTEASDLSLSASSFNSEVTQLNSTIVTFNQEIKGRPELGVYRESDSVIDIYFYTSENELLHTLIHEFGHALGLSHDTDQNSVMYMYTTDTVNITARDTQALRQACTPKPYWDIAAGNLADASVLLKQVLQTDVIPAILRLKQNLR